MQIDFMDLTPTARLLKSRVLERWSDQLHNAQYIGGSAVDLFEERLSARLRCRHTVSCASGTDALRLALQAGGIGTGDRVALPNLTFWATYEAVAQLAAAPILVEVNQDDLQLDFTELQRVHKHERLRAVIFVHLMGWTSSRLNEFRSFCKDENILLIEDGAQAFGVEVSGESIFSEAFAATLSFYPTKVLGGCMDGGAVCTNNEGLAERCRKLANHGRIDRYAHDCVGWNSRLSTLQAVYLLAGLEIIDEVLESRRSLLDRYQELLSAAAEQIQCFGPPAGIQGNGYLCVTTLPGRSAEEIAARLSRRGVGSGRVYPHTIDSQPPVGAVQRTSEFAFSRRFCSEVLNLPLYYGIRPEQVEFAAKALLEELNM